MLLNLYLHLNEYESMRNHNESICKFRKKIEQGFGGGGRQKDFKKHKKKILEKNSIKLLFKKRIGI